MPQPEPSHPSADQLRDFSLGIVTDTELDRISTHLLECAACCALLDQLEAHDGLLSRLQETDEVRSGARGPAHRRGARLIGKLLRGEEPVKEERNDLGFLQPAGRPDSLGRLGHYEVLEILGRGGFGIVFRAFDERLQRIVAIKVLVPEMAATSPARKRFLREARTAAQVRHEHVVQIYAVEEEPLPYLVMEFIPGETLQQRLERTGPLDVGEVVAIGRQTAEGLAAAHAARLIHRDIKPANILIEEGPRVRVKITDFGLARAADDASLTQSGTVAGTPLYMSPEQARGDTLDHRTDLFSLGSVLYAITSGRPPFRAETPLAVLKRVTEEMPRAIPEIIPETPPWLCAVVSRLMAKSPEERFQTAAEAAQALVNGLATPKTVASAAPRPAARSRRLPLTGGALALVAVLAVTAYLLTRPDAQLQSSPEPKPDAGNTDFNFIGSGLNRPWPVAFDTAGNLYVANVGNDAIGKYDSSGNPINARHITGLSNPTFMAFDADGNLYVSNQRGGIVSKYSATGALVNADFITGLQTPLGVAIDRAGNVYVATFHDHLVRKYDASGRAVNTSFINTGETNPAALAFDSAGNLYVVTGPQGTVRKYDSSGGLIDAAFVSVTDARGLAIDSSDNLYICDFFGNRVVQVTPAAIATTVVAGLNGPTGVACNGRNLYVTNEGNNTVTKVTLPEGKRPSRERERSSFLPRTITLARRAGVIMSGEPGASATGGFFPPPVADAPGSPTSAVATAPAGPSGRWSAPCRRSRSRRRRTDPRTPDAPCRPADA